MCLEFSKLPGWIGVEQEESSEAIMGKTGTVSQTMVRIGDFTGRFSLGR